MKKLIILMLLSIVGICLKAQTVNIHKKNGSVIKIALQDFDYMDISGTTPSSYKQQGVLPRNRTTRGISQISGKWKTNHQIVMVRQSGSSITGERYDNSGKHRGNIKAVLRGNTVEGTTLWDGRTTKFRWKIAGNGKQFSGSWGWNSYTDGGSWNGTKEAGDIGLNISGKWNTNHQVVMVRQSGSSITGERYDNSGKHRGNIKAVLRGNTVEGTTLWDGRTTKFRWKIAENGKQFSGSWGWNSYTDGGSWNGTKR